jgi:putative phosphonate catabolism associated alcohol dehydrogenase
VPGILGHEMVGQVVDGGGEVLDLQGAPVRVGDRVTWTEYVACGACRPCRLTGLPQKCARLRKYGHEAISRPPHLLGGFAEYCHVLPGTGILRVPDELSDAEAAPVNCGVATVAAVIEAAAIGVGDRVVVQGLGLLGLFAVAFARARGAHRVVGLDGIPERLQLARRFGVDTVVDTGACSPAEVRAQILDACPPDGPDTVIELCGDPAAVPQALQLLRIGGRCVVAGLVWPGAEIVLDASRLVSRMLTVVGVHNYEPRHLVQALGFVQRHRRALPIGELVQEGWTLERLDEAFARADARRVARVGVVPSAGGPAPAGELARPLAEWGPA